MALHIGSVTVSCPKPGCFGHFEISIYSEIYGADRDGRRGQRELNPVIDHVSCNHEDVYEDEVRARAIDLHTK